MKTIVLFVILGVIVQNDAISYNEKFDQCVNELNLSHQEILRIHKKHFHTENHYGYVRFMECFWKKIGFMYPNGEVNYDAIKNMYVDLMRARFDAPTSWRRANEIVNQCRGIRGHSPGITAIKTGSCLNVAANRR